MSQPANSLVCWLAGGLSRVPVGSDGLPTHSCVDHLVDSSEPYPLALPGYLPFGVEILVESVAQTALSMRICALAPRPVRGPVSYGTIAVTSHAFRLTGCGLVDPG